MRAPRSEPKRIHDGLDRRSIQGRLTVPTRWQRADGRDGKCSDAMDAALSQCHFAVEPRLLFGVEFEVDAAGNGDALEYFERMPGVLGVLQSRDG